MSVRYTPVQEGFYGLMFIINNTVSFNEEDGHLENQNADESVLMAASTRRLLAVLISNQGNPVERDCLFKTVWDDNGMRSSNSNLNQYVSILRKQLSQVGLPDDAIITIPRVGFMFNPQIEVRQKIPVMAGPSLRANRLFHHFISGGLYYPVFTGSVFLLCVSVFFLYFYEREPGKVMLNTIAGYPAGCHVYALPGGTSVNKRAPVPFIAESCDEGSVYFLFNHADPPDDRLIVTCEESTPGYFSLCHNRRDGQG